MLPIVLAVVSVVGLEVMNGSTRVADLPCGTKLRVTESLHASAPAAVVFSKSSATLSFPAGDGPRRLFVFVDGQLRSLVDANGSLRIIIPLSNRDAHKIVTGSAIGSSAQSAAAVCQPRS
jgi:hypothetical protein